MTTILDSITLVGAGAVLGHVATYLWATQRIERIRYGEWWNARRHIASYLTDPLPPAFPGAGAEWHAGQIAKCATDIAVTTEPPAPEEARLLLVALRSAVVAQSAAKLEWERSHAATGDHASRRGDALPG